MPLDEDLKIKIVLEMAKLDYPKLVIRNFQRENLPVIPCEKTVRRVFDKFLETGSIHDRERSGRPTTATDEKVDEINEVLSVSPINTVCNIAREVNMSKSVVHRTMREVLGFKPYKMQLTQQLYDEDKDLRVEMAELLLPIVTDRNNDGLIFFSDEATFHLSGVVNKHNCRIWSENNPFMTVEVALSSPKIIVWCAMSSNEIVGPFFFEELTVNQENYLDILESFFYPYLQRRKITKKIIFQQDDAPAHFAKSIRSWLNEKFDNRWIGRGGSISWAPRSPDMTLWIFFFGVI